MENNNLVCSKNFYTRDEANKKLANLNWFKASDKEIQEYLLELPEKYNGYINDLSDRPEIFNDFEVLKMENIFVNDHFVHSVFQVKSNFTGEISQKVYTSWKKGVFHSVRSIILLEKEGEISHFMVRKCSRFAICKEIYEAIGSIYPPLEFRNERTHYLSYIEDQISEITRIPNVSFSKYFDLGQIYPDPAMSDNMVNLCAMTIKIRDENEIISYIKDKKYDDKGYSFSFEVLPTSELLSFLSKTNDSFLLSLFGRLQALNVIKL